MNKKVLLLALGAFFCQIAFLPVFAVRAKNTVEIIVQPDGTRLSVRLNGDEFHHYQSTDDGIMIKKNAKGYFTYATVNQKGAIVESNIIARNANKRTKSELQFLKTNNPRMVTQSLQNVRQKSRMALANVDKPRKAYPLNGSPKALVILANFQDKAFAIEAPQASFQDLATQSGYSANGGTGSAKDYFMASSYGKFAPNFVVVGPITLPQTLAYYGTNDASGNDTYPDKMIADACVAADAAGLDFTQFDTDNDGSVDNVFVYYAGYNEAEGTVSIPNANAIWPHRWSLNDAGFAGAKTFDGKIVNDYSCTSELKGATGTNMCGIGTFCHEFGHVLELPDFYHTAATTNINTLNEWDIMDYGAYSNKGRTPPVFSAYERFFLGYLTPHQVSTPSDLTLLPLYQGTTQPTNTDNQAFLFSATTHNLNGAAPSPAEFFLVEYRKQTGWDTYLPAEGMCVWHIDFLQSQWNENTPNNYTGSSQTLNSHMRVYLQPLSGSTTTPGTAFTTGSYTPTTWSGTNINRAITSISKTASNVAFKLMGGTPEPTISTTGTLSAFSTIVGTPSAVQSIQLSGAALTNYVDVILVDKTNYDIKLPSLGTWVKSLTIAPTGGVVSETLQIRYNPTAGGAQNDQISMTSIGASTVTTSLTGTATVPFDPNAPATYFGKVDNLLKFPATKLNVVSTKIINIKTTDITSALTVALSGADAALFTVSVSSLTKDAANATTGSNVTITYKPITIGTHAAVLTISGGGLSPEKVITLQGSGI